MQWQIEQIELGESIPWCIHKDVAGKIIRIEYSGAYNCYRVTCSCQKVYQLSVTGRYIEKR